MSTETVITTELNLLPADNARLANLCGSLDANLRHIERRLGVTINNRGNYFKIIGTAKTADIAGQLLDALYASTHTETLSSEAVHLALQDVAAADEPARAHQGEVSIKTRRGVIKGQGANQRAWLQRIMRHDLSFGIGPAGTGKTYLAVASAVAALEQDRARRIVLVRPAVEAGEKLGFLPGDMSQKVDPYLRPLYDALFEMLGFERVTKYLDNNVIEVAPLAFMRGRTLNASFIILDEAQNATVQQMKMFLTRIGFGSTAVVTGDITQIDLPSEKRSGLKHVIDILKDEEQISFTFFQSRDVVRHPLVARILDSYARREGR